MFGAIESLELRRDLLARVVLGGVVGLEQLQALLVYS